jgi:clan AA aspartic protease (TIGR02281 family)
MDRCLTTAFAVSIFALSSNVPLAAAAEPTSKQIYEAATTGHLEQAQQMISAVLANHPKSAKAHWIQAEIFAREGKTNLARSEVLETQRLDPGLTKFTSKAVRDLRTRLGLPSMDPKLNDQLGKRYPDTRIPLASKGGGLIAAAILNNSIKLDFIVDSGASELSIPADVFSTLVRNNTVNQADMTGLRNYKNADGKISQANTFLIRSLKIGNLEVFKVQAKVAPTNAPPLLGQSFLKRFKAWSIDNSTRELILQR